MAVHSPFHLHSSRDCCTARHGTQELKPYAGFGLTYHFMQMILSNLRISTCVGVSAFCALLDSNALFLRDSDCSALLVAILDSYWRHCGSIDWF